MTLDLAEFKTTYDRWVAKSLPDYQAGRMENIVKKYPFIVSDNIPWTPFTGNPSHLTFGLITSGGLYLKTSQPPFDTTSIHGDVSFRELPKSVRPQDIGIAHRHYDHSLAEQDINTIFPIQRLIELEQEGIIGRLAPINYSFSYVNDVVTLVQKSIPELIFRLKSQGIDALYLVPV